MMWVWIMGIVLVAAIVLVGAVFLPLLPLWIKATSSGVSVTFLNLIGMKLRGLSTDFVVDWAIQLNKAGLDIPTNSLEAHILAGGNLDRVSRAIILAQKAGLDMDFDKLAAIDLAGRDVVTAVEACNTPVVFECPPAGVDPVMGVAKDGIRVRARVRVTVRTNLARLVGGAGEATILARVGEGIVAAIGSLPSHKDVLERPELISRYILGRGLDSGTTFEIVSVDVSDVEIMDNVGARLAEEQAEADKQVAQARAEMRRAAAVARGTEMGARVTEMTAQVTAARAILPLSIANSCRTGNIWRSPRPVYSAMERHLWNTPKY